MLTSHFLVRRQWEGDEEEEGGGGGHLRAPSAASRDVSAIVVLGDGFFCRRYY